MVTPRELWRRLCRRIATRRGNVAMLSALLIPAMTGATGLGVEVSYWGLRQIELQRIADAAALAATTAANGGATDQSAANTGADVAELNGASGQTTRSWTAGTGTLADNKITIKKVSGIRTSTNTAFQAIIKEDVNLVVSKLISSLSNVTVSATGYAEIVTTSVQGCIMIPGTGANALLLDNNAAVATAGCGVQVNGSVSLSNNSSITATGVSAGGSITLSNGSSITGTQKSNAGTFTDVYAADSATQAALNAAKTASGSALSVAGSTTVTASPGSYSSLTVGLGGTLNLNPGLYLINGKITLSNNAVMTGTGVTVIFTDQASFNNNSSVTLSAPKTGASSGVPGIAFASSSTQDWALANNTSLSLTGVLYYPNGHIEADNNFNSSGATCSVIIAKSLTVNNNARFANNCASDSGVKSMPVPVGTPTVTLVK